MFFQLVIHVGFTSSLGGVPAIDDRAFKVACRIGPYFFFFFSHTKRWANERKLTGGLCWLTIRSKFDYHSYFVGNCCCKNIIKSRQILFDFKKKKKKNSKYVYHKFVRENSLNLFVNIVLLLPVVFFKTTFSFFFSEPLKSSRAIIRLLYKSNGRSAPPP